MVVGNVSNGTIRNLAQATRIKSHIAGIDGWQLTGDALENADVNNDGIVDKNILLFLILDLPRTLILIHRHSLYQ